MATRPGRAGAAEKPQLPTTSGVTPWRIFDSAARIERQREIGVRVDVDEPGRHHLPARVDRAAGRPVERGSTATMRPARDATSASRPGAPLPSMTCPPRISISSMAWVG